MLRRIIRRAVRHAFLLGAEQLVTPALVDATVAVMGGAYPELVKQQRARHRRRESRRGAVPPDARARPRAPRRRARARRRQRRRRVLPPRHARLPDRPHARDRGGARPRASTSTASGARMAEQRTRSEGGAQGARRQGRRAGRALPRAARRARAHRLHRPPGVRDRGREGAGDRSAATTGSPRPRRARRSRWCSTARRSTPSRVARSATPACIETRRREARVRVTDTQYALARAGAPRGRGRGGRDRRGRRGRRAHRRRAPRRDPAQPHRDARAALGAARGARRRTCSRRVRTSAPTGCASTSATSKRCRRRQLARDRGARRTPR